MTIAVQLLLAECTASAGNVKGDHHMVAVLQLLNSGANFFYNSGKLMAERCAYTRIRYQTVIEMKVGATNTRTRNSDYCIIGMEDPGVGAVFVSTDPERSAIVHRKHIFVFWLTPFLQ